MSVKGCLLDSPTSPPLSRGWWRLALGDLNLHWCIIYLDDIVIFSKDLASHLERLEAVFQKLEEAGLKLKPSKCELFWWQIAYLGHMISAQVVATDEGKTEAIKKWPIPKNVMEILSFLGSMGYYHRFIPRFVQVAQPLHKLTLHENAGKKKAAIQWDSRCQQAFDDLKRLCTTMPILAYIDFTQPFKLHTDACGSGLGAVFYMTCEDGTDAVIAYASRSLTKAESHYHAHKLEFLTLKWAVVEKFHKYLYGSTFDIYTDNKSLIYILTRAKLDAASHCWVASLANYNFWLYYWAGKTKHRCKCLIKGVLARMCAWQLSYSSQGHSGSSVSCARGCPQRPHKSHRGLQLQSACSGHSPGQSAGCLYDLRRLASSPAGNPNPTFSHL